MRTVWHYCIIAVPLVFAFSMLATITDSILTKAVPSSDTGKTPQRRSDRYLLSFESTGHFPAPITAVEHQEHWVNTQIWPGTRWVLAEQMNGTGGANIGWT